MSGSAPVVALLDDVHASFREAIGARGWTLLDLSDRPSGWELRLAGAEILVVRSRTKVTADLLALCPSVRLVARAGTGTDSIDTGALDESGIALATASGANSRAVVEHTWALILGCLRRIAEADRSLREGRWEKARFLGTEVFGKTLGVVGLGRVGGEVARVGLALGMRVVWTDPHVSSEESGLPDARRVALDELLESADVVTLHLPLDSGTEYLLDEEGLRRMKAGGLLVNTARGGLVDERALVRVLDDGHLAGAAMDVFESEPDVPAALARHERVLVTPHIGGATRESQARVGSDLARAVLAWWDGEHSGG
jgi:D-3-phosphoglycerate dehydrogenase